MGYSISCPARSKKLRDQMLDFMEANFKSWEALDGKEPSEYDIVPTMHLGYDNGKCRIGFNYGPMRSGHRAYVYAVLKWMCLRVGKRKRLCVMHGTDVFDSVHYYVYDGHDACPIGLISEFEEKLPPRPTFQHDGWQLHYPNGWHKTFHDTMPITYASLLYEGLFDRVPEKLIVAELDRLSKLWDSK